MKSTVNASSQALARRSARSEAGIGLIMAGGV